MKVLTRIVLATGNPGKVRELRTLLATSPFEILGLTDFTDLTDVPETGSTFRENAELKAAGFALQTGELCLADDSGLEVAALGGAPGVLSARFAGEGTGYDVKIPKLLEQIRETNTTDRIARFVCAMSLSDPDARILHTVEADCPGTIANEPRGERGFGYDPIFIPNDYDLTFGELDDAVKRSISHRAQATRLMMRFLLDFIAV